MTKTVILYHKDCTDGLGAKYAAWKKFGDNAEYHAVQYGKPLPDFEQGPDTNLFLLDFSVPSRSDLEALGDACGKVVICDHHQTAREALEGCNHPNVEIVFDMNRSGAVIAWNYFFPDETVPMLLQYIQDRDLWKFKFGDDSKTIHAGLGTLKGNMGNWDHYAMDETELHELFDAGNVLLERDKASVEAQVPSSVRVVNFMNYRCGFLNTGQLVSEMGHAMYSDETLNVDIGICWFTLNDNQVVLSLRSKQDGGPDVSKIASQLQGGGHRNAAGCRVHISEMDSILNGEWSD